jgi:hypothetical protein
MRRSFDPKEMIATIVNGRSGALTVNGTTYNGKMPAWTGQLSNSDIAAVATYICSAWTSTCSPPLYSMKPSRRNLFMKKLTRERVVPTISASVS